MLLIYSYIEIKVKNSGKNEDDDASINLKTSDRHSERNVDDNEKVRIKSITDLVSLLVAEAPDIKGTYLKYKLIIENNSSINGIFHNRSE